MKIYTPIFPGAANGALTSNSSGGLVAITGGAPGQVATIDANGDWTYATVQGSSSSQTVTQVGHGLAVGDVIRVSGTNTYTKACADSVANAEVIGVVTTVAGNDITMTLSGVMTTGVPVAAAGTVFFLDPTTAGAVTSTAPSVAGQVSKPVMVIVESGAKAVFLNLRGQVVTVTPFSNVGDAGQVLTSNGAGYLPTFQTVTIPQINMQGGRLTLESGVPVSTTDQSAKTTLYFTHYQHNLITLYTGSAWVTRTFSELSLSLSGYTAALPYDIWAYDNAGTVALESTVWTNATTRATALVRQDGVLCKSGAPTRRYLGTIYMSATGQTMDTLTKRFVWNMYNRTRRQMYKIPNSSPTYTTVNVWRQFNADATQQIEVVNGLNDDAIEITALGTFYLAAGVDGGCIGIGDNSTSSIPVGILTHMARFGAPVAGMSFPGTSRYVTVPRVGYSYFALLEYCMYGSPTIYSSTAQGPSTDTYHSGLYASWSC